MLKSISALKTGQPGKQTTGDLVFQVPAYVKECSLYYEECFENGESEDHFEVALNTD